MIPSLEGWPTKAKEAPSPHEVRMSPLDTNPVFQSLGGDYFRLALKAQDIGRFLWWMCCKTETWIKLLSLKSSNFSKFFPNPLKLVEKHNRAQKCVGDCHKNDALAQTNQVKYDCFFFAWHRKYKKIIKALFHYPRYYLIQWHQFLSM